MADRNLQLLVSLNALYSGNSSFSKAGKELGSLQEKTESLRKVIGKTGDYTAQREALKQTQEQIANLKAKYESGSAAVIEAQNKQRQIGDSYALSEVRLKELDAELLKSRGAYQAQAEKVSELAKRLQADEAKTGKPNTALRAELKAEQVQLKNLKAETQRANTAYKEQAKVVKNLEAQHKAAGVEVRVMESEQKKLQDQIAKTSERANSESNALQKLGNDLSASKIKIQEAEKAHERLAAAVERSDKAQKNYNAIKQNLSWENIKNKAVLPAVEAYGTISPFVNISADFEAAMARVKAVAFSGVDADLSQFEELRDLAAQLGADTQFTSIQAAQSMENLARAGLGTDEIKQAMPALLSMAAAEGMDLAQGAGIMAGAMKGFEGKRSSTQIADMLAYTSANSATSIANLGEAVKVAAGTASKLNVAPEKLLSYLGALANRQVEGSQAGATITNALTRLSDTDTQKKLAELGIRTITKDGHLVELPEILRQFAEKTDKKGEVWQTDKLQEIFGAGYGKFMAGFMSEVSSGSQEKLQSGLYTGSAGSSKRMADINLDTLQGQIMLLGSAWDGFKTSIGDTFTPIVRAGVEALSNALSKITSLMKEFPTISKAVTLAIGGLVSGRAIMGVASIAKNFLALPGAFMQVISAGRNVSSVLASVGGVAPQVGGAFSSLVPVVSGAFGGIKTAALGALSPIMAHPIIAGGAALIAGVVLLANHWDSVKEKFFAVCDFCREKWAALSDWWNSWSFPQVFSGIANYFSGTVNNIKKMWADITSYFASWSFPDIFSGLKNSFISVCESLKGVWQGVCDFFSSLNPFSGMGEKISGIVKNGGEQQYKNAMSAIDNWGPPALHAEGGIFTRPHMGVVAEDGPEAIIPLSNKSRGLPLLYEAARSLGVGENFAGSGNSQVMNNNASVNNNPVINISVDGGNSDGEDLANKIAIAVRSAWEDLQERQERLAYA